MPSGQRHPGHDEPPKVGTSGGSPERASFVDLAFQHIFHDLTAPFDDETRRAPRR
jgi:hypothetical protein